MVDRRRPRGTLRDRASVGWQIERANKEQFAQWAMQVGTTGAGLLDYLIEHAQASTTPDGLPVWMPEELRSKGDRLIE